MDNQAQYSHSGVIQTTRIAPNTGSSGRPGSPAISENSQSSKQSAKTTRTPTSFSGATWPTNPTTLSSSRQKPLAVLGGTNVVSPTLLECEFTKVLNCGQEFQTNQVDEWVDHHIKHMKGQFPPRCICWYCDEYTFDSTEGINRGDPAWNFHRRMLHIARHLTDREPRGVLTNTPDYHMLYHLTEKGIIPREKFEDQVPRDARWVFSPESVIARRKAREEEQKKRRELYELDKKERLRLRREGASLSVKSGSSNSSTSFSRRRSSRREVSVIQPSPPQSHRSFNSTIDSEHIRHRTTTRATPDKIPLPQFDTPTYESGKLVIHDIGRGLRVGDWRACRLAVPDYLAKEDTVRTPHNLDMEARKRKRLLRNLDQGRDITPGSAGSSHPNESSDPTEAETPDSRSKDSGKMKSVWTSVPRLEEPACIKNTSRIQSPQAARRIKKLATRRGKYKLRALVNLALSGIDILFEDMGLAPPVPSEHVRVSWTCGCRRRLSVTVSEHQLLDAVEYAKCAAGSPSSPVSIISSKSVITTRSTQSNQSVDSTASPATGMSSPPLSGSQQLQGPPQGATANSMQPVPVTPPGTARYLLLCVSRSRTEIKLEHVDMTYVSQDEVLFRKIREQYAKVRGKPRSRFIPPLLVPRTMHFVKFELIRRFKTQDCVGSWEPDSFPTPKDIMNGSYHMRPAVPEVGKLPLSPSDFMHYFLDPGDHAYSLAVERLPKKLRTRVSACPDNTSVPVAWGIFIVEGLNPWVVSSLAVCVISLVVLGVWAVNRDGGTATGMGQYLTGLVALVLVFREVGVKK